MAFCRNGSEFGDGARGGAAAVPADHDAIELEAAALNIRYEDHRTAGFEQHAFVHHFHRRRFIAVGLADDDQIETPPQAAELFGGAGDAGIDAAALEGHADAFGGRLEAGDRGFHRLLGFDALRLDVRRWNAAHNRAGDDRVVNNGHAQHMRAERVGHRNGVFPGGIAFAQAEIDDDILDHDDFS